MLGLIKKDLLIVRRSLKTIFIMLIVFIIVSFEGYNNMLFFSIFISVMLAISTFSYDEFSKWDYYAITLPGGKKNIVKAKYISVMIILGISVLITLSLSVLLSYINKNIILYDTFIELMWSGLAIIFMISVMYPLIFKFGIEKGRIWLFVGIFVISTIIGVVIRNFDLKVPQWIIIFFSRNYLIFIPILVMISLFVSYIISKHIYMKKDL